MLGKHQSIVGKRHNATVPSLCSVHFPSQRQREPDGKRPHTTHEEENRQQFTATIWASSVAHGLIALFRNPLTWSRLPFISLYLLIPHPTTPLQGAFGFQHLLIVFPANTNPHHSQSSASSRPYCPSVSMKTWKVLAASETSPSILPDAPVATSAARPRRRPPALLPVNPLL